MGLIFTSLAVASDRMWWRPAAEVVVVVVVWRRDPVRCCPSDAAGDASTGQRRWCPCHDLRPRGHVGPRLHPQRRTVWVSSPAPWIGRISSACWRRQVLTEAVDSTRTRRVFCVCSSGGIGTDRTRTGWRRPLSWGFRLPSRSTRFRHSCERCCCCC